MEWEQRARCGNLYYCRTLRVGSSKRVRQYLGNGPVAESAAATDAFRRADRNAQAALQREEWTRVQDVDRILLHFCQHMSVLATGALVAAGCYRECGWWRN
jgi:hypothetical protein